jgi:hypothetical protein
MYDGMRELTAWLHDPTMRKEAYVFLAMIGRCLVDSDGGTNEFFRRPPITIIMRH